MKKIFWMFVAAMAWTGCSDDNGAEAPVPSDTLELSAETLAFDADGSVHVRELSTDSCTDLYMSATKPVIGSYGNNENFKIGDATVAVKNIGKDSVEVSIADKDGNVTTKKLYIDSDNAHWLMLSMVERDKCYVVSKDGKTLVHLNIRPGNPFKDGKVDLVAYTDVIDVQNGTDWVSDPRFLARPET